MALVINDRVKETSTTEGTGTFNLNGAATGFEGFVAGIGDGNTTYYCIFNQGTTEWEVGLGTLSTSTNLQRTTIITSSNSDSAVDFSSGTKDVFCTLPASKAVYLDASGNPVGAIASLVADTSPQLGGDLDLNSQNLDFPTTSNISDCLDEDAMGSNSATALATQQSIKAYSDAQGETFPTFTSTTPSVATNDLTSLVIAGTNFGSAGIPTVDFQSTTGIITPANSVVRDSATQLTVGCTLTTDGTYYIRIELNTGLAVRSETAVLTISDVPLWVTASGSLGSFPGGDAIPTVTLTATDATSFAITTGAIATPLTFTTGVGSCTITGTQTQHSVAATDSFTVTATDAEGQTAARAFTMTWTFGASSGGQFN